MYQYRKIIIEPVKEKGLGTTNLNTRGPWTLPLSLSLSFFLSLSLSLSLALFLRRPFRHGWQQQTRECLLILRSGLCEVQPAASVAPAQALGRARRPHRGG